MIKIIIKICVAILSIFIIIFSYYVHLTELSKITLLYQGEKKVYYVPEYMVDKEIDGDSMYILVGLPSVKRWSFENLLRMPKYSVNNIELLYMKIYKGQMEKVFLWKSVLGDLIGSRDFPHFLEGSVVVEEDGLSNISLVTAPWQGDELGVYNIEFKEIKFPDENKDGLKEQFLKRVNRKL